MEYFHYFIWGLIIGYDSLDKHGKSIEYPENVLVNNTLHVQRYYQIQICHLGNCHCWFRLQLWVFLAGFVSLNDIIIQLSHIFIQLSCIPEWKEHLPSSFMINLVSLSHRLQRFYIFFFLDQKHNIFINPSSYKF